MPIQEKYELKDINSIRGLWEEYRYTIRPLDVKYPTKGRKMAAWRIDNEQQGKAYSRRLYFFQWMERLMKKNTEEESLRVIEDAYKKSGRVFSTWIDKLRKDARQERREEVRQ